MTASRLRLAVAVVAGLAWAFTLPLAADALRAERETWAAPAFVAAALGVAATWWIHVQERSRRIGLAAGLSGWLFIGSVALLGVAGFIWVLVVVALVAAAVAYGVLLLVTQARAPNPRPELVTGLLLFATAGATAIFTITTGLGEMDAWWLPAHVLLGAGIGAATVVGALPGSDAASA
jgi:hypothetical protein